MKREKWNERLSTWPGLKSLMRVIGQSRTLKAVYTRGYGDRILAGDGMAWEHTLDEVREFLRVATDEDFYAYVGGKK